MLYITITVVILLVVLVVVMWYLNKHMDRVDVKDYNPIETRTIIYDKSDIYIKYFIFIWFDNEMTVQNQIETYYGDKVSSKVIWKDKIKNYAEYSKLLTRYSVDKDDSDVIMISHWVHDKLKD